MILHYFKTNDNRVFVGNLLFFQKKYSSRVAHEVLFTQDRIDYLDIIGLTYQRGIKYSTPQFSNIGLSDSINTITSKVLADIFRSLADFVLTRCPLLLNCCFFLKIAKRSFLSSRNQRTIAITILSAEVI